MSQQNITYSIWVRPTQNQIDELTAIVSKLAFQNSTIPFPPHLTLLSSISTDLNTIDNACNKLIERHNSFDISLSNISFTNAYYKNLFIQAEINDELRNLYEDTKTLLSFKSDENYMPHISLLYGQLSKEKQKQIKKELDGCYFNLFNCQRLDIYNSTGKENEWYLVKSFHLPKN